MGKDIKKEANRLNVCDLAITRKQIHRELLDSKFKNLNGQLVCIVTGEICQNSSRDIPADFCPFLDRYMAHLKQLDRARSSPLVFEIYKKSDTAQRLVKNNGTYTLRKV